MANLAGHEGGNAGYSQGTPTAACHSVIRPRRGWREGGGPRGMRSHKTRIGRSAEPVCTVRGIAWGTRPLPLPFDLRQEPSAVIPRAGICAGGAGQPASLPQTSMDTPSHLSDDDLVARVKSLARYEREATASLIAHLAELDARRLYLGAGFSSLFTYCCSVLHLSEPAAYNRIEAARAARTFPVILQMLWRGLVEPGDGAPARLSSDGGEPPGAPGGGNGQEQAAGWLLRHAIPTGDLAEVIDRALTTLLEDLARKKFAATERPRASRGAATGSRDIAAKVRRAVWLRDRGVCAFVSKSGRRCKERAFIQFHHVDPHAVGGEAMVENIQLRCGPHNRYEGLLFFGHERPAGRGTRPGKSSSPLP
jgi:hypothetical protein